MLNKIKKWIKKKIALLSLSLANVEKNALGQQAERITDDVNHVRRNTQGQLADSLIHGEVTQEVLDLRWRTYKILKHVEGFNSEIIGYDNDGLPIVKTKKIDKKKGLDNIKIDDFDEYPLELSFANESSTIGINDTLSSNYIVEKDEPVLTEHGHGIADISGMEYYGFYKQTKPLNVERVITPKFDLEKYTLKLHVRTIDDERKLLEFYVSKYPNELIKTSRLFINEIKKAIKNPIASNMLDIKFVSFVTNNTVGADNFNFFKYEIVKFDKIVEFNGHYVIKFIAKTMINGEDILEKYRQTELDEKYKKMQPKR